MKVDELFHHGILGQKWGIRRFQNEDGTYTELGKRRKRDDHADNLSEEDLRKAVKRAQLENRYKAATSKPGKVSQVLNLGAQGIKTVGAASTLAGTASGKEVPKEVAKQRRETGENLQKLGKSAGNIANTVPNFKRYDLSEYSDEELETMVRKAELEKQYNSLVKDAKFNEGMQMANTILSTAGSAVTLTTAGIMLYKLLKQ